MKRFTFKISIVYLLVFVLTLCHLLSLNDNSKTVSASNEVTPSFEIVKNNVSYSSEIYILYAVSYEGFNPSSSQFELLLWDSIQEEYVKGTEHHVSTQRGSQNIDGVKCKVFYSQGLAAKNMADDLYARAYLKIDEKEYYSEIVKFSVVEYVYKMKEESSLNPHQMKLLDALLEYGGAAQNNFDYNTDRLANDKYYKIKVKNGYLPDGFTHGRYKLYEKVVLKPNDVKGMKFSHWIDEKNVIVSYNKEFEFEVTGEKEFTAIFKDVTNISSQLKMAMETTYDTTVEDLDLPNAVSFEINGQNYTLNISWDLTKFVEGQIGIQKLYATLDDLDAYERFNIGENDIYIEINVLPYTYELDSTTGYYIVTGYYGADESIVIPSLYKNTLITSIAKKAFNEVNTLKEIIVPNTIKLIEQGAFYYCNNIEKITVPFVGRSEDDCQTKGYSHFGYIFEAPSYDHQEDFVPQELVSVTISEGAKNIGEYAFYNLNQIEELYIPSTIEYIYQKAFYNCDILISFTINSNLKGIGPNAFEKCKSLCRVDIESYDVLFNFSNELYFNNPQDYYTPFQNNAELYINNELVTELIIPSNYDGRNTLLAGCSSIEKLTISKSVKSLNSSFHNMKNLKELIFEKDSKLNYIGEYAFSNCSSLEAVIIPNTVKIIDSYAFYNCNNLTQIDLPSSLTDIYNNAFYGCHSVETIEIPAGTMNIGKYAFAYCSTIESIEIPENITVIEDGLFYGCTNLVNIKLSERTETIGGYAFNNCKNLNYINIPETVTEIEAYAFSGCSSLEEIIIPNKIYVINSGTFENCSNLKKVVLSESLATIEERSFYKCSSLTHIELPSRVRAIGDSAFYGCKLLYVITNKSDLELTLGSSKDGYVAMYAKCIVDKDGNLVCEDGYTYVITDDGFVFENYNQEYSLISYIGSEETVTLPLTVNGESYKIYQLKGVENVIIPEGITTISESAFDGSTSLKSIVVPSTVKNICKYAFNNCSAEIIWNNPTVEVLEDYSFAGYKGINLDIPNSVKVIGENAFKDIELPLDLGNTSVETLSDYALANYKGTIIILPSSLTNIGSYVLDYSNAVEEIYYQGTIDSWKKIDFSTNTSNPLYYVSNLYILNNNGEYTIVDEIEILYNENSIGNYQFSGFNNVTSIVISSALTSIGYAAFNNCTNLTNVYYKGTFDDWCNISFASQQSNPMYYAENFYMLDENNEWYLVEEFEISENIKTIGKYQFYGFKILKSITIHANTSSFEMKSFYECDNLISVYYEGTMKNWSYILFSDEYSNPMRFAKDFYMKDNNDNWQLVTTIEIPSNITKVNNYLFYGFYNLTEIIIPSNVTNFYSNVFTNCVNLKDVYYKGTIEDWCNIRFNSETSNPMYYAENFYMLDDDNNWYEVTTIDIPETITKINSYQFFGFQNIKKINIPDTITSIGTGAFANCSSLTRIDLPEGIERINIDTFNNCTSLRKVVIPSTVITIMNDAFYNCVELKTVYNLSKLNLVAGKTSYGYVAYYAENIYPEVYKEILTYDEQLDLVVPYDFSIGDLNLPSVLVFKNEACEDVLINVNWDLSMFVEKQIGYQYIPGTFYSDELDLEDYEISIPQEFIIIVSEYTFSLDENKNEYFIIKYYGDETNVNIPNTINNINVTKIEKEVFLNNEKITSISLSSNITYIDYQAFAGCINLSTVKYQGSIYDWCQINFESVMSNPMYYAEHFYLNNSWKELVEIEIPEGITEIGAYQFYGFENITIVSLPSTIVNICNEAFYNCVSLNQVNNLSNLELSIGSNDYGYVAYYAQYVYNGIPKEIIIEKEVLYDTTFENLGLSDSVIIDYDGEEIKLNVQWDSTTFVQNKIGIQKIYGRLENDDFYNIYCISRDDIYYQINVLPYTLSFDEDTNSYSFTKYYGEDFNVYLKDSFNGFAITKIDDYAFADSINLTSIRFPQSLISIGDSAFAGCDKLGNVSFPQTLTQIGANAFNNCSALTSLVLNEGLTTIGKSAFSNCSKITNITLSSTVSSIGSDAFLNCNELSKVYYTTGTVETWCKIRFENYASNPMCYAQNIYMSNKWTATTKITIPETITFIGDYQFYGFENITTVTLSASVESIGIDAFYNNSSLKIIYNSSNLKLVIGSTEYGYIAYYADVIY